MKWFPRPAGEFEPEELSCRLTRKRGRGRATVLRDFAFSDGSRMWSVPEGFEFDGASFPGFLRWLPAIVAVLILAIEQQLVGTISTAGLLRALIYPALMQWLIGWPLEEDVREAAGVHDRGYFEGRRAKWICDRAFFLALWLRIWLDLQRGDFGAPDCAIANARAWFRLGRAAVWTGVLFLFGWFAWWGHRLRERRARKAREGGR